MKLLAWRVKAIQRRALKLNFIAFILKSDQIAACTVIKLMLNVTDKQENFFFKLASSLIMQFL